MALEKNWGTLSAAITATSDFLSLSVTVPMYFMVLAALACIGGIIFLGFYLYEYFKEAPVESIDPFGVQTITRGGGRKGHVTMSAAAPVLPPPPKEKLSAGEIKVLGEFASEGVTRFPLMILRGRAKKSDIEIEYIVSKLVDKNLVVVSNNVISGSTIFLTDEGKRFIMECGEKNAVGVWNFKE
ncbi:MULTISPECIES: hypothetical protein [Pseudomonas fluorescens group]|uniref:hypothetical protein n=1 Tax=Pseudomonas fluorescens group TaxID=136843 RepID=UPI000F56DD70|nr:MULTISPECIES: hypothetical protein [Pseudomonas fluorescens group]